MQSHRSIDYLWTKLTQVSDISRSSDQYSWHKIETPFGSSIGAMKRSMRNEQISRIFRAKYRSGLLVKRNARLRTSQLPRAPPRWLWKFRKDLTRSSDLTFPLTRVVLYFSFPHLSYENYELLIRGFSCVVQIDSMCLKMWSKHAVVKCDARASH